MSTLYLVSTPIGNLDDVSFRAADVLRSVARVFAEDTRRSRVLLQRVGSEAKLVSLHAHNERSRVDEVVGSLDRGEDVALVTDAGTPLVSDPGSRVVVAAVDAGHVPVPVPGPSAVLVGLVGAALPSERFVFLGFPERKGEARRRDLERVATSGETVVLFESPTRLKALLEDLAAMCEPERRAAVGRELTKVHEEFVRGRLSELAAHFGSNPARGEITLVVEPAKRAEPGGQGAEANAAARTLLSDGRMTPSDVVRALSVCLGLARNEAYRIVHDLEPGTSDDGRE